MTTRYTEALRGLCIAHAKFRHSRPEESVRRWDAASVAVRAASAGTTKAERLAAHAAMRAEFGPNYLPATSDSEAA
jgi:hypothetical protein